MHHTPRSRLATTSALAALGGLALAISCNDAGTAPERAARTERPNLATVGARQSYTPSLVDGVYLLDRVCDVFIGDDPLLSSYTHQIQVDVPAGSKVRLVGDAKTFTCDARDYDAEGNLILVDGQPQPVIDPATLHAVKGDGPKINTDGIDFDLNGYSIAVYPTPADDDRFENLGVVVAGSGVTVRNSAVVTTDEAGNTTGVSRIYGFGHNIDVEAHNPTVQGEIFDGVYNLETAGGMGVRLASGTVLVDKVKSVNLDPVEGQGFAIRRCGTSTSTITNSWFVGGTEGAFIRECGGVTFANNTVSGQAGDGIVTRQATSTTTRPIVIRDNKVFDSVNGIVWGRDSRSSGGLSIAGNTVTNATCGVGRSTRNTTIAPYAGVGAIAAANTMVNVTRAACSTD